MQYEIKRRYSGPAENTRVTWNTTETRFTALASTEDAGYTVSFEMQAPIADTYIMVPACAYNGNRFETVMRTYPPMFTEEELGVDVPVRMTCVPHLEREGDSFMDVTTGDLAVPCVCVLNKALGEAFMVFFDQGAHGLNHGVSLEQCGDMLKIELRAPAKRRVVYRWYDMIPSVRENPDADQPLSVDAGDETVIPHRIYTFPCADIPALYRAFFEKRHTLYQSGAHANLPFSAYWDMAEEQLVTTHYEEKEKFITLDNVAHASHYGFWQCGWVGGGMNTYPMICEGGELARTRAIETLEFAARYQSQKGWFYGIVNNGKIYHDCFKHYEGKYNMILIRKHADLVYFMAKQIIALDKMGVAVPDSVRKSLRMGADALVKVWKKYGQMGQFINAETGEIVVGGSTSGAITPAALAAAAVAAGCDCYRQYAREIGQYYYDTATAVGVTTGGPGEILQAPDSESAAALLESYVALYEQDDDKKWLGYACDAAHQVSSWVVSYDYRFPPESRFGRMGIRSAGSVWANVQNKHSAPGMCTLSAVTLLKLYRATGDEMYLELMRQIAHFIPQVASYPQRPMITADGRTMDPSGICERVNLSDWETAEGVGDSIFGSSSWPEVSLMLTWLEVPGVYVVPSRGIVCVSDHVNAWMENGRLYIQNPTVLPARVKVLVEEENEMQRKLGLYWQDAFRRVEVASGECVSVEL